MSTGRLHRGPEQGEHLSDLLECQVDLLLCGSAMSNEAIEVLTDMLGQETATNIAALRPFLICWSTCVIGHKISCHGELARRSLATENRRVSWRVLKDSSLPQVQVVTSIRITTFVRLAEHVMS
jgi:hypothetical protein